MTLDYAVTSLTLVVLFFAIFFSAGYVLTEIISFFENANKPDDPKDDKR